MSSSSSPDVRVVRVPNGHIVIKIPVILPLRPLFGQVGTMPVTSRMNSVQVRLNVWTDAEGKRIPGRAVRVEDTVYATADFPEEQAHKVPFEYLALPRP